jgi:hypothetical protein
MTALCHLLLAAAVGPERIARDAPNLGAQFAQMVKELRSEYFAAITLCAEKLAYTLATQQPTSVILILRHHGLKAQSSQTQGAVRRSSRREGYGVVWKGRLQCQ